MASPVWTLVLVLGAACGQGHLSASVWEEEEPPGQKPVKNHSVITQCDFDDNSKPFCDWTQVSTDDGDWIRTSGPSLMGDAGPSGDYPNGEGYYLHMDSRVFHQNRVARLVSSPIWEQGPLCVHFAYHMFGFAWGAQLKLLLLTGTQNNQCNLLWRHINTQSPSWMSTAVTVPQGHALPSQLVFEGVRSSPAYVDISLDAVSIRRGACTRVCMVRMCSFDTENDHCGWSCIPTDSGATWVQKKGSSGVPNVGPKDDFSRPGCGFYMLLDPMDAKPRQQSVLLSPLIQSSGCLTLSFYYTLHGQSPGAALTIYASVFGSFENHSLFSGQPGPNWQPASVNYRGQGQIQFAMVGVFGQIPEPAVAVDAISIVPCEESFPQCNFEDDAHPFCDWVQASGDGGQWTRGSKNMTIHSTGPFGGSFNQEDVYIYLEADELSQVGQSFRLVSRPFCAPGAFCVQFAYHMYGPGEGTKLALLLESPAGSSPTSLWQSAGSQSADWLNASISVPAGHQQPMQLILEAIRGTSTAFVVAVDFILMHHGACQGSVPTTLPSNPPTPPTGPSETLLSTGKPTVPTGEPTLLTEKPTIPTEKPTLLTEKPTLLTEKPTILTEKPTIPTEKPTVPTEEHTVPTEKPTVPTEEPTVPTERPTVPTERPTVPTERPTSPTTLEPAGPMAFMMYSSTPNTSVTTVAPLTTAMPASCPPNAHYVPCACLASCHDPRPNCERDCKPGCVCNSGFLFSDSHCINASSCNCFYSNNYYKPGAEWFSPNCTEYCHCWPGGQVECQLSQCRAPMVCLLKNSQYGCHPYASAGTCFVYGDPHYHTFDGRHFSFMGKCTYVLAEPCGNSTVPFFKVAAKNKERGQEGMSCLSKVYVTLSETTITLLRGRHVLVDGQQVTLPIIPYEGIFLVPSGRFVELQTVFGLRVRWDGDQQLFLSVPSTYSNTLCGICGNYDGDSSNDNQMPDGNPAQDEEELGNSWQTVEDMEEEIYSSEFCDFCGKTYYTDSISVGEYSGGRSAAAEEKLGKSWHIDEDIYKKCPKKEEYTPSCNSTLRNTLSQPQFCGRLIVPDGAFEACLPHLPASFFFNNCLLEMCNFQGLQQMLCAHISAMTETCQDAGYMVKPWRGPQFCPLDCPPNSKYTMCAKPCPETCHSKFSGMFCKDRCVEGCECDPGFVLSGLQCVPRSQCGCLEPTGRYFMLGQHWFNPDCKRLCICDANDKIICVPWKCQTQQICAQQDGIYGCYGQGSATCTISGDPHYVTFDGALHHFMGTCSYTLTKVCGLKPLENTFTVIATNEFRGGNSEASYVKAVHVHVFNLTVSLIKGHKVVLNGHRVTLPVWPAQGRVGIRPSGSFILFYTDFGLQVRYDGNHLVKVTVPSTYAGRLCGLCGNYNNNSRDDNLKPDKKAAADSIQLGGSWKSYQYSESSCFFEGVGPSRCQENEVADSWNKNCYIIIDPLGPFSKCHEAVSSYSSFVSCVHGQCATKGDTLTLCRSLQAYASMCAQAGHAPAWRNSTFCPLKCPAGSSYSPCANPCPATCPRPSPPQDCPALLPCTEGCECQRGYILSGTTCVPLGQCGCTDPRGFYYPVGESWYANSICSRLCSCSTYNNISCLQTSCKHGHACWPLDGLLRCRAADMGTCQTSDSSHYVSFDGSYHVIRSTCTYVLVKTCHFTRVLPFFMVRGENGKREGPSPAFYLRQVDIDILNSLITLQMGHRVLINGTQVTLPSANRIPGVRISTHGTHTVVSIYIGIQVKFDGSGFLEIEIPRAYYEKVCGICGNFNGEEEDDLMMPSDELAQSDTEFVDSWQDKEANPSCQQDDQMGTRAGHEETMPSNCMPAYQARAQGQCQVAFQAPAWTRCAAHVARKPFLLSCVHKACEFRDLNRGLCESLQEFGAACQSHGLKPPIWRNSSFCPLECPAYSTFTACTPPCSPSCWDLEGQCKDSRVPATCEEGCVCQPGYVLSEQQCVPRTQCGCKDARGHSLPAGKTWLSSDCTQSCACKAGDIQCQPFSCPSGSRCQSRSNGNSRCGPYKLDQCSVFGDPRYQTFDGLSYRFQGRMTYILIKTVDMLPAGTVPLAVEGRNKVYAPLNQVFLHEIIVMVYGYTVQLQAELQLVVNNQKMRVPYNPSRHLHVTIRSHQLYLITDFELVVSFDGRSTAVISLPSAYQGLVRGLCGNFDKNQKNEFMLPNGALAQNLNDFGHSWEVKIKGGLARFPRAIQEEEEGQEKSGFYEPQCSREQLELINSTQACRVLVDPQGPFAACHQTVAPEPFLEHCIFDLCVTWDAKEQQELRCRVLSGYAIICQEAGTTLASWRDHTHCALACPANTIYQSCMTPCPASCANLEAPRGCEGPCVEGCASLPGYVYSGAQSLPLALCGCTSNGIYYQLGDSFVSEDCSQRCTCASPEALLCESFSCSAGETCTLGNLTRGCFRESPCLQNPCQNDGHCQEQGTHFTCECELGYGGDLCTELRDVPPPEKPGASDFVATLLGMLVPVVAIVLAVIRGCVSKKREKMQSQNRDRLAHTDFVPEPAFKVIQF